MAKFKDISGQKFNRLTAIRPVRFDTEKRKRIKWLCKCDCGGETYAENCDLVSGKIKSCGCYIREKLRSNSLDLIGKKFGRLTVVQLVEIKNGQKYWLCHCDCGGETITTSHNLNTGVTTSCGCYAKEQRIKACTKHGQANTKLYKVWSSMKQRCSYDKIEKFRRNYIDRGITVCDEWKNFEPFYKWAVSNGCSDGLTIDRIDNDGNYCPENCRWITNKEQQLNKRTNRLLTYNGETKTITEFAEQYGIDLSRVIDRLKRGWSVEDALTKKVATHEKFITYNGKTLSLRGWERETGISYSVISKRLRQGWSIENALTIRDGRYRKVTKELEPSK